MHAHPPANTNKVLFFLLNATNDFYRLRQNVSMRPEAAGETALPAVTSGCAAHKVLRSGVLVLQCAALVCHSESINTTNSRPSVRPKNCWCLRCISWLLLQNSLQRLGVATKQPLGAMISVSLLPLYPHSPSLSPSSDPCIPFIPHYPHNSLLPLPITPSLRLAHLFHRLPLRQIVPSLL